MEHTFNKLVRDRIPDIIKSKNENSVIRILNDEEYRKELYKKLLEEANEVIEASNQEGVLEEMADVLEVLRAIAKLENKSIEDILDIANRKRIRRGGFEQRIFLIKKYDK